MTVLAVLAVSVMTATYLELNPPFRHPEIRWLDLFIVLSIILVGYALEGLDQAENR